MPERIRYHVMRLPGPENKLEDQLNVQGAVPLVLASLLYDPQPGAGPYLAVFYEKVTF